MSIPLKYFVLRPSEKDPHGVASICALRTYAKEIERHDPGLAHELNTWIKKATGVNAVKPPPKLYVKGIVTTVNIHTGDRVFKWLESTDGKTFVAGHASVSAIDLQRNEYPGVPPEVIRLLKL